MVSLIAQSVQKSPPVSKLTSPSSGVGTVLLLLLLLAAIETVSNQDFYKLLTGKTPLTKSGGTTLLDTLSADGLKALAWTVGAGADLVLAAYLPGVAVPMTIVIVLGVLLTHEQTIAGYIKNMTSAIQGPKK